jgi:hypothetical protein
MLIGRATAAAGPVSSGISLPSEGGGATDESAYVGLAQVEVVTSRLRAHLTGCAATIVAFSSTERAENGNAHDGDRVVVHRVDRLALLALLLLPQGGIRTVPNDMEHR